ncbi:MAG TPA: hypothetical protein VIX17_00455 [Pyrinomonadaceae bacterium]|jgi:hypothetical protein
MKLLASMLFSAALLVTASSVEVVAQKIPEISSRRAPIDRYPTHQVTFENGVQSIPDVIYASPVGYRALTLDL